MESTSTSSTVAIPRSMAPASLRRSAVPDPRLGAGAGARGRPSSRPTPRGSSVNTCTASRTAATPVVSTPAPGPTTSRAIARRARGHRQAGSRGSPHRRRVNRDDWRRISVFDGLVAAKISGKGRTATATGSGPRQALGVKVHRRPRRPARRDARAERELDLVRPAHPTSSDVTLADRVRRHQRARVWAPTTALSSSPTSATPDRAEPRSRSLEVVSRGRLAGGDRRPGSRPGRLRGRAPQVASAKRLEEIREGVE